MLISQREFDDLLKNNQLTIALIGLSGMGKSYRSEQLKKIGFRHLCADSFIEQNLGSLPSIGLGGVAEWMGQPYGPNYPEREIEYLKLEAQAMKNFLLRFTDNRVIDTTGSVIYLSSDIKDLLKKRALIVYLEANQSVCDKLFEVYMSDPKPVVWGQSFLIDNGESKTQALKRCYPQLLKFRAKEYEEWADITLPFEIARDEQSGGQEFLEEIKKRLR